jgi:CTP synthase (UTP-ammonia lyase)
MSGVCVGLKLMNGNLFNERVCANEDCLKTFVAKSYNAIYCGAECRKICTNKKLLEKYYENKALRTKKRVCKTSQCTTILSIYNKENICERCKKERYIQRLVSWGWSEEELRKES